MGVTCEFRSPRHSLYMEVETKNSLNFRMKMLSRLSTLGLSKSNCCQSDSNPFTTTTKKMREKREENTKNKLQRVRVLYGSLLTLVGVYSTRFGVRVGSLWLCPCATCGLCPPPPGLDWAADTPPFEHVVMRFYCSLICWVYVFLMALTWLHRGLRCDNIWRGWSVVQVFI